MRRFRSALLPAVLLAAAAAAAANPVEVGRVDWRRDLDAAIAESARSGTPVLAFFQEVPGCAGCKKFGGEVMSDPLIVQTIEREFLPVLIYNNRPGEDARQLKRFGEPAWNFQVVRFLDGRGRDLIPRRDRVWTREGIAARMIAALEAAGREAPPYLRVAAYENDSERQGVAAFAQSCFWSGEAALGRIAGVVETEAGWIGGHEVTRVRYHVGLLSLDELLREAISAGVADTVYLADPAERERVRGLGLLPVEPLDESYREAAASDQKKQIEGSALGRLELSPMQRTKVNAFAPLGLERALAWLTPAQRVALTADQPKR